MDSRNQGISTMDKNSALEIANRYLNLLKNNQYNVIKAYLFGSYSKNTYNENSDIDLALVFENIENKFQFQVEMLMLTTDIDTRIEPHPFSLDEFITKNPFVKEILKYGLELKSNTTIN